jgi:hypothetical protein
MTDDVIETETPAPEAPQPVRYVTYNDAGQLDGCYDQVPPEDHAARMIVVDEVVAADWVHYHANEARDGVEPIPPSPPPLPTVDDYVNAIQAMLDTKVQERRYLSILSACSYAASTNATFKAEADACTAWRDAVWLKAYSVLDEVEAGTVAQPTIPELLAMLPALTWPT